MRLSRYGVKEYEEILKGKATCRLQGKSPVEYNNINNSYWSAGVASWFLAIGQTSPWTGFLESCHQRI